MASNGVATQADKRISFGKIKLANQYPDLLEIVDVKVEWR